MDSNDAVVLKAEILANCKDVCPVCGIMEKSKKARTCRICYNALRPEITKRVDEVAAACEEAVEGHQVAISTENAVSREVKSKKILSLVKIDKDAKLYAPTNGVKPYWECQKTVPGGYMSLFVFGAEEAKPGSEVTAIVEFKDKAIKNGIVTYARAQVVPDGIRSNVKLAVGHYNDKANYKNDLTILQVSEGNRRYSVGFVPVVKVKLG